MRHQRPPWTNAANHRLYYRLAAAALGVWVVRVLYEFWWEVRTAMAALDDHEETVRVCRAVVSQGMMTDALFHACRASEAVIARGVVMSALGTTFSNTWPCHHADPLCLGAGLALVQSWFLVGLLVLLPTALVLLVVFMACGGGGCSRALSHWPRNRIGDGRGHGRHHALLMNED